MKWVLHLGVNRQNPCVTTHVQSYNYFPYNYLLFPYNYFPLCCKRSKWEKTMFWCIQDSWILIMFLTPSRVGTKGLILTFLLKCHLWFQEILQCQTCKSTSPVIYDNKPLAGQQQRYISHTLLWSHPPREVELPEWNIGLNSLRGILIQPHWIFSAVLSSWFCYPTTVGVNKNQTQRLYQKHKTRISFPNVTWYLTY